MSRHAPLRRLGLLLALVVLAASPVGAGAAAQQVPVVGFAVDRLTIESGSGSHPFTVEIARSPEQLAQGLMFRTRLGPDAGMLFDIDPVRPISMWMKNTLIALDMLFIDADGRIAAIAADTTPGSLETIAPPIPVRGVLEVPAGTAKRLGIVPGDLVRHALFGTAG